MENRAGLEWKIHNFNLDLHKNQEAPSYYENREKIIYSVTWPSRDELALTWENRHQNYSVVSVCEALRGACTDNLVMTAPGGWLELEEPPLFTKDGRRFTMALSANGYKQVNVINRDTNQRVPITSGRMVVTNIYHWDEVNHEIYFKVAERNHSSYFLTKNVCRPPRRIPPERDTSTR